MTASTVRARPSPARRKPRPDARRAAVAPSAAASDVHCLAYENGKVLGDVPVAEISDVLARKGTFVWVSLHEPDHATMHTMQEEFGLHDLAVEDASTAKQRPKIESFRDYLFIALKTVALDGDESVYGELHLFAGAKFLLSVRRGPSVDEASIRQRCEERAAMMARGPAFVLYSLIDCVVDQYQPSLEHFQEAFEAIEDDVFADQLHPELFRSIHHLKRQLLQLRNAALPVAEICSELMRLHEDLVSKDLEPYFRDVEDHVAHVVAMADSIQDLLNSAMQVNLALVGVRQNDVVKRLAGWGAVLAVPTVVFSLYGMNFKFMPELQWHWGYPVTIAVTASACALLYLRLRKAGWI